MEKVFGEAGRHARSAVGVPVLPLGAAVEVDAIVAVKARLSSRRLIARPFAHRGPARARAASRTAAPPSRRRSRRGTASSSTCRPAPTGRRWSSTTSGLERLAEHAGRSAAWSAAELGRIRLRDSDETIPSLAEILALIAGRAPLLIEVKSPGRRRSRALPSGRRGAERL